MKTSAHQSKLPHLVIEQPFVCLLSGEGDRKRRERGKGRERERERKEGREGERELCLVHKSLCLNANLKT